jgi:hypothetical protein
MDPLYTHNISNTLTQSGYEEDLYTFYSKSINKSIIKNPTHEKN